MMIDENASGVGGCENQAVKIFYGSLPATLDTEPGDMVYFS